MTTMNLRDYQDTAIQHVRQSLIGGKKRPVLQMPTGAGKTIAAAAIVNMAQEKGKKVLFCVPAISLIDQTVERFEQNGIWDIGVIQVMHERTDYRQPVQVCSVQTLQNRVIPKADLIIIDEAHVTFNFYHDWFNHPDWRNVPVIGLTATPWAKGMGLLWDDLIIGTTTQELINQGHLSDFKVMAPSHPDLGGVKTVAGDYDQKQLGAAMDKAPLVADIVSTWLERGQNRPTLCFAVNRAHAQNIEKKFQEAGVRTAYLDAFTELDERKRIADDFASRAVQVVCNVGVLTTGVDWDVRCVILARPTKSEILYTQIIGRGLRTAQGKDHCLILDHSDTTLRLGFVTDIHHTKLDDGAKKKKPDPRKKEEKLPRECKACTYLIPAKIYICPHCGVKPKPFDQVDHIDGELVEMGRDGKKKASAYTMDEKSKFYCELIGYAEMRGFKSGWAYHSYKDKFGVAPANGMDKSPLPPSPATLSWIRHRNIVKAKSKAK